MRDVGLEMVGDPFCPRTRGGAEWTIRSLHDQPLVSLKYLVPRLPRLAVEQDEVIAHGNRRLPPPCDGTVKQYLDGLCNSGSFKTADPSVWTLAAPVDSGRCRWSADDDRRTRTARGSLVAARVAALATTQSGGRWQIDVRRRLLRRCWRQGCWASCLSGAVHAERHGLLLAVQFSRELI